MAIILILLITLLVYGLRKSNKNHSNNNNEIKITTKTYVGETEGKPIRFSYKEIGEINYHLDEASKYWKRPYIIEMYEKEGDAEGVEREKKRQIKEESDYYGGVAFYDQKFGQLEGTEIKKVVKNLKKIIDFDGGFYEDSVISSMNQFNSLFGNIGEDLERNKKEYYGGEWEVNTDEGMKMIFYEGWKDIFRRDLCSSTEIISDDDLEKFFVFNQDSYLKNEINTSKDWYVKSKRIIRKDFIEGYKKLYNTKEKTWEDFDINSMFMQIRTLMFFEGINMPQWIWNIIEGNPFNRVYRVARDYMKWKGTKRTAKIVFNNICMWENGKIFRKDEELYEEQKPLWVQWNIVGKDLLALKTKLKKEDKGGIDWLKEEVGPYIKERASFYKEFGKESKYNIKDELLNKFELL